MTQEEHDKFSELFGNILTHSCIQHAIEPNGEAYVVYGDVGIFFSITFNKVRNSYILGNSALLKSFYKQYGISADAVPDHKMIFDTVAFAYKTQQTILRAQKDFSELYKEVLIESDIVYKMRGSFETYTVTNAGIPGYTIGYDKETDTYRLTMHELIKTLYSVCGIPTDRKPNCESLYKRTKDYYMAQTVVECMRDFKIY